jgi:hypothetical protein
MSWLGNDFQPALFCHPLDGFDARIAGQCMVVYFVNSTHFDDWARIVFDCQRAIMRSGDRWSRGMIRLNL